jgi:hypothetical protein
MKNLFTFFAAVVLTANVFAQAPQKMSYQAVIRNSSNALVSSTAVSMRISILQGSTSGTAVYVETQAATTNANGLVSIEIGAGTAVTGTFAGIDWSAGQYFIKTETDPAGGTSYSITGTSQLLSVPYALSAASASSIVNPTGLVVPKLTTTQINALPVSPAPFGTIVFNTTTNALVGYRTKSSTMSAPTYTSVGGGTSLTGSITLAPSSAIKQTLNFLTPTIINSISINADPNSGSVISNGVLTLKIYSGAVGSGTLISTSTTTVSTMGPPSIFYFYFSGSTTITGQGYFTLETDSGASIRLTNTTSDQVSGSTQQAYDASGNLISGKSWPFSITGTSITSQTGWISFQ